MKALWGIIACCSIILGCRGSGPVAPREMAAPSANESRSFQMFAVYSGKGARSTHYAPSGYMGDSDLTLSGAYLKTPFGNGPSLRATYKPSGPSGWAGLFWQDPPNNWGATPGKAGYDLRGASRLTFWARGEKGGERVHEFRIGGVVGKYPDSDIAKLSNVKLTDEWKQYTIDLSGKDLRHIITGFGFSVLKAENPRGMQFYLNEIVFEGLTSAPAEPSTSTPAPTLEGRLPAETTAAASVPVVAPLPSTATVTVSKDLVVKEVETGLKVNFSSRLMFVPGQAVLERASHKALDQLSTLLNAYPTNRVLIEGHTDSTGEKRFNLRLSELRAKEVRDYLIKRGGYDASRFQVLGYGDTKPVASNKDKAGRSLNRRVEVTILKGAK